MGCIICSKRFSRCWLLLLLELCSTGSEKDYDCVYLYPYKNVSLTFNCKICSPSPQKCEQLGAGHKLHRRGSCPFTIVSVPAHQVRTFEWPKLLSSFRYLATSVMGWNNFSQWLETYLLTCLGDTHPYTCCIPSIHFRMQCGRVSGIAARGYVSMLRKT